MSRWDRLIEGVVIAAIFALLLALLYVGNSTRERFERACDEVGGKTVYDGRAYQCWKEGR